MFPVAAGPLPVPTPSAVGSLGAGVFVIAAAARFRRNCCEARGEALWGQRTLAHLLFVEAVVRLPAGSQSILAGADGNRGGAATLHQLACMMPPVYAPRGPVYAPSGLVFLIAMRRERTRRSPIAESRIDALTGL